MDRQQCNKSAVFCADISQLHITKWFNSFVLQLEPPLQTVTLQERAPKRICVQLVMDFTSKYHFKVQFCVIFFQVKGHWT